MDRKLLARRCANASSTTQREYYWDYAARTQVNVDLPTGAACTPFALAKGTLIDSWYEGTTKVESKMAWDGTGRPPQQMYELVYTPNADGGGETPCGLKIDDVQVSGTGSDYTITIFTSGYSGAVEYSLNQFTDVQDSNIFTGLEPGTYIAYARAKK